MSSTLLNSPGVFLFSFHAGLSVSNSNTLPVTLTSLSVLTSFFVPPLSPSLSPLLGVYLWVVVQNVVIHNPLDKINQFPVDKY